MRGVGSLAVRRKEAQVPMVLPEMGVQGRATVPTVSRE